MKRRTFLACGAAFAAAGMRPARADNSIKMPALVENNRFFANFDFPNAAGGTERLLTWVDTGGSGVVLARAVAEKLGLKIDSRAAPPSGRLPLGLHAVYVDALRLPVSIAGTTAAETRVVAPGMPCPAFLPGSVLADHVATFDYTNRALWIDGPPLVGGVAMIVEIARASRFPRVELEIDGERMGFLLDTGASFTMLSQTVIDRLRAKHPDWAYVQGGYGPANMIGKGDADSHMLRIPGAKFGPFDITPLDVVSREGGAFETRLSRMMSAPIVGALAGNVLRNFALRLDYPNGMLDVLFAENPWPPALTMVPLILQAGADGTYAIAGGTASSGIAGAQLLAVENQPVEGLTLLQVQDLLRGNRGERRAVRVRGARGVRTVRLRVAQIF